MKTAVTKLKATIASLAQLIEKERQAIFERAYDKIAALSKDKASLLDEFNDLLASVEKNDTVAGLNDSLAELREQAEANAEILKQLSAGVQNARQTLRMLNEKDFGAGAYQRDGEMIKKSHATTISAKI